MSSLRVVDVYADGRRVAYTYMDPAGHLWSDVKLRDQEAPPPRKSKDCEHEIAEDAFAYDGAHWPIRYCPDCRLILTLRSPPRQEAPEDDGLA